MLSDAVLLALIATITPTLTAIGALILALRTHGKLSEKEKYELGASDARERRQRRTDPKPDEEVPP